MKNYQKIIDAFLMGNVGNMEEKGMRPEHIETQISHVFLFPKTVYKISKRDNLFFNENFRNVLDREMRLDFYKADFFENSYFSPDVYLNLFGIGADGEIVVLNDDIDNSEDVIMKMRRIGEKNNLSTLLHEKAISKEEFQMMGFQQTKAVALYPHQPKTSDSYYEIFLRRLEDTKTWMFSAPDYWSKEEVDRIIQKMINYVENNKNYFINFNTKEFVVSLDNHSDNIFFENEKIFFLDIYPPKEDWIIASAQLNIYRPATDILILMGAEYARAFIQGYIDYYGLLDERHELFYFLYSAIIQGVSLHNLSKSNQVKKEDSILYKKYILKNIDNLV